MGFWLSARKRDGCVVVEAHGDCDLSTAPALRKLLLGLLARRPAVMVVDLSGLGFLDCGRGGRHGAPARVPYPSWGCSRSPCQPMATAPW